MNTLVVGIDAVRHRPEPIWLKVRSVAGARIGAWKPGLARCPGRSSSARSSILPIRSGRPSPVTSPTAARFDERSSSPCSSPRRRRTCRCPGPGSSTRRSPPVSRVITSPLPSPFQSPTSSTWVASGTLQVAWRSGSHDVGQPVVGQHHEAARPDRRRRRRPAAPRSSGRPRPCARRSAAAEPAERSARRWPSAWPVRMRHRPSARSRTTTSPTPSPLRSRPDPTTAVYDEPTVCAASTGVPSTALPTFGHDVDVRRSSRRPRRADRHR